MTNAAATTEAKPRRDYHEEFFQEGFDNDLVEAMAAAQATIGDFAARLADGKGFDCMFGSEIGRAVEAIATVNVLNSLDRNRPTTNHDLCNRLSDGLSNAALCIGNNGGGHALLEVATVKAWRNMQFRFTY